MVSIIIPTRDQASALKKCVHSIFEKTDYPAYELIVLDNESDDSEALEFLAGSKNVTAFGWSGSTMHLITAA